MQESSTPSPQGQLRDPAFRAAMLSKLESLLAVLEIARSKAEDGVVTRPNEARRLIRLQDNLEKTLDICRKARRALKKQERADRAQMDELGYRQFIESSSFGEFVRMRAVMPITNDDVSSANLDSLCRQLFDFKG